MKKKWQKPELIVLRKGSPKRLFSQTAKQSVSAGQSQPNPVGQNCGNNKVGFLSKLPGPSTFFMI